MKMFLFKMVLLAVIGLAFSAKAQQPVSAPGISSGTWSGSFDALGCRGCKGKMRLDLVIENEGITSVHVWSKLDSDSAPDLKDKGIATGAQLKMSKGKTVATYPGDVELTFAIQQDGRVVGQMDPTLDPRRNTWKVVDFTLTRTK